MHFTLLTTGLAGLLVIPEVSAHLRVYRCSGDYPKYGVHFSDGLHFDHGLARNGKADPIPYQMDVSVFSSPVIPSSWESPYKNQPRKYLETGCGSSMNRITHYWKKQPQHFTPYGEHHHLAWKHRMIHFYERPVDSNTLHDTKGAILAAANKNRILKVTLGGWLEFVYYQVNDDGAGPFRCRYDETGTGTKFGPWMANIGRPDINGDHSVNYKGNGWDHGFKVPIPKNIKCSATYGAYKNVCVLRCENFAKNGPFGACIPFQVIYPTPPSPPKTSPKPPPPRPTLPPPRPTNPANPNSPRPLTTTTTPKTTTTTPPPPPPTTTPPSKPVDVKEPEPEPVYGDPGYDVDDNYDEGASKYNKQRKRDIDGKVERRVAVAELDDAEPEE
ncbi:hypothetical protein TWF970_009827 [Orbilia oligospora]|uniref:Uncharacterized protein n=1 Tax=Orbilia oligospora TaxID=2813651 RepID=A0A7C8VL24_ORBOL|nr:hypothetical protein TWF970_009827 [Orbilia oligospora]